MHAAAVHADSLDASVLRVLRQYWGFDALRPLQREAIQAGVDNRDSLVVLPTGGGKSLCYQVPPIVTGRVDVVVSPLISLMKDQVDGLRESGYPAISLHSGQGHTVNRELQREIIEGRYKLVFVAPERLLSPAFLEICDHLPIGAFAVDEAHCISHWGHDFRPDYRKLAALRRRYPHVSLHAYTATATPRVRLDIAEQLRLRDPAVLVGDFDRPNLTYRVIPKLQLLPQVLEIIEGRPREAVIVYCISRRDTEELAAALSARGIRAAHYHAGMRPADRQRTQDAFQQEQLHVIVATVAFGMGIDRSDVRCVIHAAMPKSVEHYQQEAGRAGRDGLPADCVLLYSPADAIRWEELVTKSAHETQAAPEGLRAQIELLRHMRGYCDAPLCRHAYLVEYFGQRLTHTDCRACDVCLGETEPADDATELARKILSGVARVEQRFGVGHVCDVLLGKSTKSIRHCGHDQLSTFGLLRQHDPDELKHTVHMLVDRAYLDRTPGDRPILKLTHAGLRALRGEERVMLRLPKRSAVVRSAAPGPWTDLERELFEALRSLRRDIARQRGVPPFVIFHDTTLRELARQRPQDLNAFRAIRGVGANKAGEYGKRFMAAISEYCRAKQAPPNAPAPAALATLIGPSRSSPAIQPACTSRQLARE